MAVKRLGNGFFEIGPHHRVALQAFQQHLPFVQKAGGAVAALKGKVGDEALAILDQR